MFSKHVTKNLSAYCHGEVAAEESRRIAEHLIGCNRCRGRFEEIKLGVKLAERLPQLAAPDSLWVDFQSRLVAETSHSRIESSKQSRFSFKLRQPGFAGVAAGLLLSAVLGCTAVERPRVDGSGRCCLRDSARDWSWHTLL